MKLSGMAISKRPLRDRGAVSNPSGRYERFRSEPFDDGWESSDPEPAPIKTSITPEKTRTIIARNDSPDVPFDRSINPYKGCEHGCVYCFARPTHAYLDLSPGLDFESRIIFKPDAPERLSKELAHPKYRCEVIALGANTDPYQPAERKLQITRKVLEVLAEHEHPVSVVTKSNLVLRDLDLLAAMAKKHLAFVLISMTTLDRVLDRRMEPRAPTPERRIQAMRRLSDAGVPVGVLSSPMIPGLNDSEMESILESSAKAGAGFAGYIMIRLPREVKKLFTEWLETHYPSKASRVIHLIRESHGGKLYEPEFGVRMRGNGEYADMLEKRFQVAVRRFGLSTETPILDSSRFRVPLRKGDQIRLFEE
jgi:DNA repair photolyase